MKLLVLTKVEQQTLREMGILHEHHRTRMRAQAILRLSQGLTLQQTGDGNALVFKEPGKSAVAARSVSKMSGAPYR